MQRTTRLKRPQVPEPGELIDFDDIVGRPKYAGEEMTSETNIPSVTAETEARQAADQEIWTEIETIEASSDVVDVVGTYAELEAYDTSKLHDKDLIKVLSDETRDDAITYYRYSTSTETFTYVGAEGPYYTASETDVLLNAKQDTLIAGSNIQIAADGKTISATDTTYSNFTGATASTAGAAGLVPAPAAGAQNKVLKGDGTWKDEGEVTIFYVSQFSSTTGNITFYKDENLTNAYTYKEVEEAIESGATEVRAHWTAGAANVYDAVFTPLSLYVKRDTANPGVYSDYRIYFKGNYTAPNDYKLVFYLFIPQNSPETNTAVFNPAYTEFITSSDYATTTKYGIVKIGDNLTTDSSNKLIAKTMTGATASTAGTVGVVPAPAAGDEGKYLKGDGTWATVSGGASATTFYLGASLHTAASTTPFQVSIFSDSGLVDTATVSDVANALNSGLVNLVYAAGSEYYVVASYVFTNPSGLSIRLLENPTLNTMYALVGNMSNTYFGVSKVDIQKKLAAGSNITISDNTISATDAVTRFYTVDFISGTSTTRDFYSDENLTQLVGFNDVLSALQNGRVILCGLDNIGTQSAPVYRLSREYAVTALSYAYSSGTLANISMCCHFLSGSNDYKKSFKITWYSAYSNWLINAYEYQPKLTAGSNISIDTTTNTISATDTTYTAGTGITISAQNVISASGAVTNNINSTDWNALWQ